MSRYWCCFKHENVFLPSLLMLFCVHFSLLRSFQMLFRSSKARRALRAASETLNIKGKRTKAFSASCHMASKKCNRFSSFGSFVLRRRSNVARLLTAELFLPLQRFAHLNFHPENIQHCEREKRKILLNFQKTRDKENSVSKFRVGWNQKKKFRRRRITYAAESFFHSKVKSFQLEACRP